MFFTPSKGNSKKFKVKTALTAVEREPLDFELMTRAEIFASVGKEFIFDAEVYINYTEISFMSVETKRFVYFEFSGENDIDRELFDLILYSFCLIGFNSNKYDIIIASAISQGFDSETIKEISDAIIKGGLKAGDIAEQYNVRILYKLNTYDLKEVAPLDESLKKYAARMHARRLQELPYPEDKHLTEHEKIRVREYNFVDDYNTDLLRAELKEQHSLRINIGRMYGGIDLRSKSDAQIAEAVIVSELRKLGRQKLSRPNVDPSYQFKYKTPSYIRFQTPYMQEVLRKVEACWFDLRGNGSPECDAISFIQPTINGRTYAMGVGGLHSMEKCQTIVSDGLMDIDFESYYPKLILNNGWFPKHLGPDFLIVLGGIVDRRLDAKAKAGLAKAIADKDSEKAWKVISDSLKITINGTFGKLGSIYSMIYSPDLLIQTTVTGQLTLLMMIEAMELTGIPVMSANTDGFVVDCKPEQQALLDHLVSSFETLSNLKTEKTKYRAIYARDVNNYIAFKPDGEVKVKGEYSEKGSTGNTRLSKNPEGLIIVDAVIAYLSKQVPLAKTIRECKDVTRFLCVRNVKGGGHYRGQYLGKTVRWIYGKGSKDSIHYTESGNTVSNSFGALPLMDLPDEFPESQIDYNRYLSYALDVLADIGAVRSKAGLFL